MLSRTNPFVPSSSLCPNQSSPTSSSSESDDELLDADPPSAFFGRPSVSTVTLHFRFQGVGVRVRRANSPFLTCSAISGSCSSLEGNCTRVSTVGEVPREWGE